MVKQIGIDRLNVEPFDADFCSLVKEVTLD